MDGRHGWLASFAARPTARKARDIARVGLVAAAVHYFTPQLVACVILQEHGWSFAATGFYWLVNGFLLGIILVHAWKPDHPLSQAGLVAALVPVAYSYTRFLGDAHLAINPASVVVNAAMAGLLAWNLLNAIAGLVAHGRRRTFLPAMARLRRNRAFLLLAACTAAWTGVTAWSYVGFSQVYTVRDFHQPSFAVSFWGSPTGGTSTGFYSTPEGIAEMTLYQQLDASFYNTIDINRINTPSYMAAQAAMLAEWAAYNISIIYDITPLNPNNGVGDFVSYYYLDQMNDTIRALADWIEAANVTNVRGISFDVEGPNFGDDQPISVEQYRRALVSYQGILDEFKARFPGTRVHLIQMEAIMFDFFDGDVDLDVALKTVSVELAWDVYGFMTYHVGPSPTFSSYRYASYLKAGVEQFGNKFQPWVGWWYDVNLTRGDVPEIDLPGLYETSLEHVKIAKSTGVQEVVLAPLRNFYSQGTNHSIVAARLADLVAIKQGFETFTIPITNNMRIVNDWPKYWEKIVPSYIWVSQDVINDLLYGTPGAWFAVLQGVLAGAAGLAMVLAVLRPGHPGRA